MDRSQLRNMIESGRAIALDCYAIGKSIPEDDPIGQLFQTDLLNKSVLIKRYQPALATARMDVHVDTVVYFPYDFDNPYDGGESTDFNSFGFPGFLMDKVSRGSETPEMIERVNKDVEILSLIDSMHSLDPFMFKSKAEQQGIDKNIHPDYFAISDAEWDKIRLPIREKISRLVTKALGGSEDGANNPTREKYIEQFLMKIWEAKDIDGIEPFVKTMKIAENRAPEVFFAWKAVCYYQVRFNELGDDLKTLFHWTGNDQLCSPVNILEVSKEEQNLLIARRDQLREKMRAGHLKAHQVLLEYENSYNQFIEADKPQGFMDFLESKSANSYLNLATHVSVATHSCNLWKWYMGQYGGRLDYQPFMELFDGLAALNGVE